MFLMPLLASIPLSQAAVGDDARNTRFQNRQVGVSSNDVVLGIVVVKLRHSISIAEGPVVQCADPLLSAFSDLGVTSLARAFPMTVSLNDAEAAKGRVDLSQIHFATIPSGMNPVEVAARLADLPQVEYAEPKYYNYTCDVPNDSDYLTIQQVYFDRMNVPSGWALQKGSADVVIATIDGGTNWQHPDLKQNIWINPIEDLNHDGIFQQFPAPAGDLNSIDDDHNGYVDDVVGWNFTNNTNIPRGLLPGNADHGTKTASAFGAVTNNGRGMAGTSWNCRIMAVCAADPSADNRVLYGFEGIAYAAAMGARVINCSWGRADGTGTYSQMEQDVITAATQKGALVVAAAGNSTLNVDDVPYYPAAYDHVLSVGATMDTSDAIAPFTDYGVNVSVFAPGVRIRVALNNGLYGTDQGTSSSSPLVAGLAGLLIAAHPEWKPEQIAGQIRITADPIDASNAGVAGSLGHGRVNFGRALSETHASIQIVSSSLYNLTGRTFALEGDTLVLSTVVKNTQATPAQGLSFAASSTDPALQILQGSAIIARLDSGQETALPDFKFRMGSLSSEHNVIVKLEWAYNVNDRDARTFRAHAFASTGLWYTQVSLPSSFLYSVKAVNNNIAWSAGGRLPAPYRPLVVRTTDGGTTWADVTGNLPTPGPGPTGIWWDRLSITAVDADRAWLANWDGRIYATTNGGSSWSQQTYPGNQSLSMDGIWFFDASNGYALGEPRVGNQFVMLRTSNGGIDWVHLPNEPVRESGEYGVTNSFWATDPDHVWFATIRWVWRTTNGGSAWSYGPSVGAIARTVSFRDNSTGLVGTTDGWLGRSLDGGATWEPTATLLRTSSIKVCYAPGSRSAWLVNADGPYRTDDDGSTLSHQPTFDPFLGYPVQISFADTNSGWFVTNQGEILRYTPARTTTVSQPPRRLLPDDFQLAQNYPNPFNPLTTIRYGLPSRSHVMLTVFNTLGQKVATLVQGEQEAGYHEAVFDASGLASGMYLYRLHAGDFVQARRLLLLKSASGSTMSEQKDGHTVDTGLSESAEPGQVPRDGQAVCTSLDPAPCQGSGAEPEPILAGMDGYFRLGHGSAWFRKLARFVDSGSGMSSGDVAANVDMASGN